MNEREALTELAKRSNDTFLGGRLTGKLAEGIAAAEALFIVDNKQSQFLNWRVKNMGNIIKEASDTLGDSITVFTDLLSQVEDKEQKLQKTSKSAIGKVKSSINELGSSMKKIDQLANFTQLQHQADCLERIASSLERISELEKTGKLSAVIQAMK